MTKLGKAKYGAKSARKYFKLKDGEQVFRILPPLGELADEGRWSVYHTVHYGYKNSENRMRPFLSPEVKGKEGQVLVEDVAKTRIETLKMELDKAKKSGNTAAVEKLNKLVGPTGMYNLDKNHYVNAIERGTGTIGILKLRHKAKLALDAEIKKLMAAGVDPLSPENGRFFTFSRSGKGLDTLFNVTVFKEKLDVPGVGMVEREVVHKLDDATVSRLSDEAGELNKLFKQVSAEDVNKIVETSDLMSGVSSYLDELFGKSGHQEVIEEHAETGEAETYKTAEAPKTVEAPKAETKVTSVTLPNTALTETVHKAQTITELSDEEFMKRLEAGTL